MMNAAITTAPAGTSGVICAPWSQSEIYGVAADWSNAAAPVYAYGTTEDGWAQTGSQVADFRHHPVEAMIDVLKRSIRMGGGDEAEAIDIAAAATTF